MATSSTRMATSSTHGEYRAHGDVLNARGAANVVFRTAMSSCPFAGPWLPVDRSCGRQRDVLNARGAANVVFRTAVSSCPFAGPWLPVDRSCGRQRFFFVVVQIF